MYKVITIGGKEYRIEYTIEASLCNDFVEKLTSYVVDFSGLTAKYDTIGKELKNKEDAIELGIKATKEMMIANATQIPALAMTGFYAGLLEHHKIGKQEAYDLYKAYLMEYRKTPTDILGEIIAKVNEDNFFAMIGLDQTKLTKANGSITKKRKGTSKKQ